MQCISIPSEILHKWYHFPHSTQKQFEWYRKFSSWVRKATCWVKDWFESEMNYSIEYFSHVRILSYILPNYCLFTFLYLAFWLSCKQTFLIFSPWTYSRKMIESVGCWLVGWIDVLGWIKKRRTLGFFIFIWNS